MRAVGAAAAIALENEDRVRELQDSRERIVTAGDDERRRLERNLHDGAQQRLVGIALQLRLLRNRVGDDPAAVALISAVSDELAHSLAELRELARGIHPSVLDHGLGGALESLIARCPVPTRLEFEAGPSLPAPVELAAYFVVSEALTNVAKYAQRDQRPRSRSRARAGRLLIRIADDGVGGASADGGSGLRGLADRVGALGGCLRVLSPAGRGTVVIAELAVWRRPSGSRSCSVCANVVHVHPQRQPGAPARSRAAHAATGPRLRRVPRQTRSRAAPTALSGWTTRSR